MPNFEQLYLDERRGGNPQLPAVIDQNFTSESSARIFGKYTCRGHLPDYLDTVAQGVTSTDLVGEQIQRLGRPVTVLDIGAGGCNPLVTLKERFGSDVRAIGVTAHGLEVLPEEHASQIEDSGVELLVGNADYWSRVVDPDLRFDVVMSKLGLRWFVDPLAAAERALSQMNEGGVFWAEPLRIPTDQGKIGMVTDALASAGYDARAAWFHRKTGIFDNIVIQKQHDRVEPIFTEVGYDDFCVNIVPPVHTLDKPGKQAYYTSLVDYPAAPLPDVRVRPNPRENAASLLVIPANW